MNVELSERARQRVAELVEEGAYPSVEAAIEAALEQLALPTTALSDERLSELLEEGYADIRAGRVHPADVVLAEARALLRQKAAKSADR